MNTQTKKATLKKSVDVRATLLAITIGSSVIIKTRDISANRIRASVSRLNNEGYSLETSEKGLVDEVKGNSVKVIAMKPKKKREYKAPKGWLTTAQVMVILGVSHLTLYRIYPDIFSESETIIFHERRIFKEERVNAYLQSQIEACSAN